MKLLLFRMNFPKNCISCILLFRNLLEVILRMLRNLSCFRALLCGVVLTFFPLTSLAAEAAESDRLPVTVRPLGDVLQASERSVTASLISLNDSTLSAELSAKVTKLLADVGDSVKTGQVLGELDCRDYVFSLKQAQAGKEAATARHDFASSQLQRNQRLRKSGVIPVETLDKAAADFDAAKADLAVAKAQEDTAQLAVSRCEIKAPFAGQITQRHLQLGQRVSPGTPAFQLLQNDALEVRANLSVDEVRDQQQGSELRFVTDGVSIPLEVRAIVTQVAGNTRTQEARFIPKGEFSLPVGRTGRVVWQGKLPVLPASWIVRREGGLGVMLAENGVAKFHLLPDAQEGQPILTDLPPETLILDQNRLRARDGQMIEVTDN